jgi:phytanoyl-CoA hydroxylase
MTSPNASGTATVRAGTHLFDEGAEMHDPKLYHPTSEAAQVETLADIGPDEIAFYRENGYLSVRQAFSPTEISDAIAGLTSLIMGEKPDFKHVYFEASVRDRIDELGPEERMNVVRKIGVFENHEPRLKAISQHPALLAVVKTLINNRQPEMFQDMALLKPPLIGREKPWHQDHAYFDYPLDTPVVGVWIALDNATPENGCMQILPGRHRGPIIHFKRRDWQICDKTIMGTNSVAAPLPSGGMLLFDGKLPHGTPHNTSPNRRRALQFHYAPNDIHKAPPEVRLAAFGSEGKDVTC